MIIEKFRETVRAAAAKIAVKEKNRTVTYEELNANAMRIAAAVQETGSGQSGRGDDGSAPRAVLIFEHGLDMITTVLAVLYANRVYVPVDNAYPLRRLTYITENSGASLILTNNKNISLAEELSRNCTGKVEILNIDTIAGKGAADVSAREASGDRPAYILYTSGSTGKPKGVVQNHDNVLYYTDQWIRRFSITEDDRMTLFSAFTHDGSVQDMFAALLAGATLYPYNARERAGSNDLPRLLEEEQVTLWHSVPSLYRYFADTLEQDKQFSNIRFVLLGGEPLREYDLVLFRRHFPAATLANVYGQTESSVDSICMIAPGDPFEKVTVGKPLDSTEMLLVGEDGEEVGELGVGEVLVACSHIAPEYWQDPEATKKAFAHDEELGRLYWTGDLGRYTADGSIKVIGRKDNQTKIRGFRVETGEIESVLLEHEAVKETAVVARDDENGETCLCAYLVTHRQPDPGEIRDYLAGELPDYMIPRYFTLLEQMPLTSSGKIDRNRLPEPDTGTSDRAPFQAPRDRTERDLAAIWQEILGVDTISIHANFMELGGHSLLIISLLSRVQQVFNVELRLQDIFMNPTIKGQARLIKSSGKSPVTTAAIEPAEEKTLYRASPTQTRMYALSRLKGIGVTYNLTGFMILDQHVDETRFEETCEALIRRHESFRTSFHLVSEQVMQKIHDRVALPLEYIEREVETDKESGAVQVGPVVSDFTRPFDLAHAPLLRIGLVNMTGNKQLLILDLHHIISDGVTGNIVMKEFTQLYAGEELPALKTRYRDYSEWLVRLEQSGQLKQQEEYWLERFSGELPQLELPTGFPRPEFRSFEGDIATFQMGREVSSALHRLATGTNTTLFILLLAIYNVFLHKYSSQEDIIVGTMNAGRNHADLEGVAGLFVKTLPLRNFPSGEKTFGQFLEEVKESTLGAFENQMYPFDRLADRVQPKKDPARNPLFDTVFLLQNTEITRSGKIARENLLPKSTYGFKDATTKFDLVLEVIDTPAEIVGSWQYCSALFKAGAIELMKERFLVLVQDIIDNRDKKISELDYMVPVEKELSQVEDVEFEF
jgi:tyrocidine synthetase-3